LTTLCDSCALLLSVSPQDAPINGEVRHDGRPFLDIKFGRFQARAVGWPAIGALILIAAGAAVFFARYLGML
jgi:hypothetical protein